MEIKDIDRLALLARLDLSQDEKEGMIKDFDSILHYIDQITGVSIENEAPLFDLTNVMRDDVHSNIPGEHTEALVREMPDSDGQYLKVKQIL